MVTGIADGVDGPGLGIDDDTVDISRGKPAIEGVGDTGHGIEGEAVEGIPVGFAADNLPVGQVDAHVGVGGSPVGVVAHQQDVRRNRDQRGDGHQRVGQQADAAVGYLQAIDPSGGIAQQDRPAGRIDGQRLGRCGRCEIFLAHHGVRIVDANHSGTAIEDIQFAVHLVLEDGAHKLPDLGVPGILVEPGSEGDAAGGHRGGYPAGGIEEHVGGDGSSRNDVDVDRAVVGQGLIAVKTDRDMPVPLFQPGDSGGRDVANNGEVLRDVAVPRTG